jgi:hypothetical protein
MKKKENINLPVLSKLLICMCVLVVIYLLYWENGILNAGRYRIKYD